MKTIVMGSDPWAWSLHRHLAARCRAWGHQVQEVTQPEGDRTPYFEAARRVAVAMNGEPGAVGLVLCGTGMGVSMVANTFPGISCALCENTLAAERSRVLNNANVLAMGEFLTTPYVAEEILKVFLATEFLTGIPPELATQIRSWHKSVAAMKANITVPGWPDRLCS